MVTLDTVSHLRRPDCRLLSATPFPSFFNRGSAGRHCLQPLVLNGLIVCPQAVHGLSLKLFQARLMASLVYLSLAPKPFGNSTGCLQGNLTELPQLCLSASSHRCSRGTVPSLDPSQRANVSPCVRAGYPHRQQILKQRTSDWDGNTILRTVRRILTNLTPRGGPIVNSFNVAGDRTQSTRS
ncbi:hypothetical protein CGRA01v4_02797 [Colletotrichum graminicola]|nr:hypothetical protein CGRA01v4_02797 [Colletotrichum graminicola]